MIKIEVMGCKDSFASTISKRCNPQQILNEVSVSGNVGHNGNVFDAEYALSDGGKYLAICRT